MGLGGGAEVKILALVKYSLDVAEIKVNATTRALRMTGVPRRFGSLDKGTVEAAVRLKEASDAVVEILCFGPPEARGAVKDLLAMGVDEATVVEDPYDGAADAAVAVRVLEAAIRKRGPYDLIICGFASDDGYSHQTGARLAERLALPFVSYACEMRLQDGLLIVDRDLEAGLQTVSVPPPAIVSIAEEAFLPRSVTLLQAMKAQRKPANVWDLEGDLGLARDELDRSSGRDVLGETGIVVDRGQRLLKGPGLAEMADLFIDMLVDAEVLVLEGER
jgi:electron transfer flavoprotein beta subunit